MTKDEYDSGEFLKDYFLPITNRYNRYKHATLTKDY